MASGDENSKFFHHYVNHRNNINSSWKIAEELGEEFEHFEYISKIGINHFEDLFMEEGSVPIAEIVKIALFFSTSVTRKKNMLMEEVYLNELT